MARHHSGQYERIGRSAASTDAPRRTENPLAPKETTSHRHRVVAEQPAMAVQGPSRAAMRAALALQQKSWALRSDKSRANRTHKSDTVANCPKYPHPVERIFEIRGTQKNGGTRPCVAEKSKPRR